MALSSVGLAIAIALSGCSAPIAPSDPDAPAAPEAPATDNGVNQNPGGLEESIIDPAFPWPSDIPRPNNIVYEFSGKNPLGEGAVREIRFLASGTAEVQGYIDTLLASGWEMGFGTGEPMEGEDGDISWLITKGDLMGTITSDDGNNPSLPWSFSLLG